jgi:hypothetical protein
MLPLNGAHKAPNDVRAAVVRTAAGCVLLRCKPTRWIKTYPGSASVPVARDTDPDGR